MYTIPSSTASIHTWSLVYSNAWQLQLTFAMSSAGACSHANTIHCPSTPHGVEQCCQCSIFATSPFHSSASGSAHPRHEGPIVVPPMVRIACQLPRLPRTSHANNHSTKQQGLPEINSHPSLRCRGAVTCMFPSLPIFCGRHSGRHACVRLRSGPAVVDQGCGSPAAPRFRAGHGRSCNTMHDQKHHAMR
jgi:hypothetical protein